MLKKILPAIKQHKISTGIIIAILAFGGYFVYGQLTKTAAQTRYVLAAAQKGTLIVSVSGSGQVSASNQVDVKPKVSGEIVYLKIKSGQDIKAGTLIAQIDSRDAQKAVRDAKTALETARLELEELLSPVDELSLLQAENSLEQANKTKQKAKEGLKKAYDDGFNTITNAFLDLPSIMAGLHDIIYSADFATGVWNADFYASAANFSDEKAIQYRDTVYKSYNKARISYDKNFSDYKSTNRFAETNTIELLINETYDATKDIAQAIKDTNNLIQFYKDKMAERSLKPMTLSETHLTSLNSYTSKTNSHLSNLLSAKNTIQNNKEAITDAEQSIKEKELSLAKIKAGADELSIRAKKIAIQQKEDALLSANQTLANYYIYAPFDGVVAEVGIKKGDSTSSGSALATFITKQKIAEISLNEVDAAKIKVGQKATLTFDAVENLSISGQVAEIDTLGTVAQGVVSYSVKISFDTQDERIKPGMSVSAAIVTEVKQNVLLVPNSAIKTTGNINYVQTLAPTQTQTASAAASQGIISLVPPQQQEVQIGISNDNSTEIVSGLKEGDQIVARTVSPTTQTTSQPTPSLFGGSTGVRIR